MIPAVEAPEYHDHRQHDAGKQVAGRERPGPVGGDPCRRRQADDDEPDQRRHFDSGQDRLGPGALPGAEVVDDGQDADGCDPGHLGGVGLPRPGPDRHRGKNVFRREEREEHPQVFAERHAQVGRATRLDGQDRDPAEQKARQRAESLFEVLVEPARLGVHRPEFGIGEGPGHRDQAADGPKQQDQARVGDRPRDEGRGQENGRAHDGAGGDADDVPDAEDAGQFRLGGWGRGGGDCGS